MPYEEDAQAGRQGTDNEEVPSSRVRIRRCKLAPLIEEPMPRSLRSQCPYVRMGSLSARDKSKDTG